MDTREIELLAKSFIDQSINGLSKENLKFDFKLKWYDLTEIKGINEFLKDTSSIANTSGLDGVIVIGFDDKKKEFQDAFLSHSRLKDSNEINGIISKNVDHPFVLNTWDTEIDGRRISVIHIPPSKSKPHVIKKFVKIDKLGNEAIELNRIFVRNNTSNSIASKYDLDTMYYDNKNIIPDYEVYVSLNWDHCRFTGGERLQIGFYILMLIENMGRRILSIKKIELFFTLVCENTHENFHFVANTVSDKGLLVLANSQVEDTISSFLSVEKIEYNGGVNLAFQTVKHIEKLNVYLKNQIKVFNVNLIFHLSGGRVIYPIVN